MNLQDGLLMDLGGEWSAAEADDDLRRSFPGPDLDDSDWAKVTVPGHWRGEAPFASSDGPLLYRRRFGTGTLAPGQRCWLVMDGVFYQSDVWLDGSYLGDTEGYFFPHAFDITASAAARPEHLLGVEVVCERPARRAGKRALTGVWGDSTCIDPSYNPGGIWAPVRLVTTGPVRISSLRISCSEAGPRRAVADFSAILDSSERLTATLRTEARLSGKGDLAVYIANQQPLAVGANRVHWRLEVPGAELWWPAGLGEQRLYDMAVAVECHGVQSDARVARTGLRHVRMSNFRCLINGEGLFLKGANVAPTRRDIACATPWQVARDVELAREAGLNLLRVRAHVARPELYQAADEKGLLIWQDLPLHGGYRGTRRQAVRQAGKAVDLLGHHPSVVIWCGHNEPFPTGPTGQGWRPSRSLWRVAAQALPNPVRSVLDRSVRRALGRADPSRPVVSNSGVLPSLARGAGSHLYFGWYHGSARDLPRAARVWPAAVRFVSELGAQSVPVAAGFMEPGLWPTLDWGALAAHYCLEQGVFERRVPPHRYASFEAWRAATQAYQASLVQCQVEALRRLRSRPTGGFAVYCLNDSQPAVSCSLLDFERQPKPAFVALQSACAPLLVTASWPAASYAPASTIGFDVHVVNDGRQPLEEAVVEARLSWPGGGRLWCLSGEVAPSSCTFVGHLTAVLPSAAKLGECSGSADRQAGPGWPLQLSLELRWGSPPQSRENHYWSMISAHPAREPSQGR